MTIDQNQSHMPDVDQDDVCFSRPTITGPFGALIDELRTTVDADLGKQLRLDASACGQTIAEHLRDILNERVRGRTHTEFLADAAKSRREAMFGRGSEQRSNTAGNPRSGDVTFLRESRA